MGRVGAAGDNAAMESFFALLQKNVLNSRRWATRDDLRLAIVTFGRLRVATELLTRIAPDDDGMTVLYRLIDAGVTLAPGSFLARRTAVARSSAEGRHEIDLTWSLPDSIDLVRVPALVHTGSCGAFLAPGADRVLELVTRAHGTGAMVSISAGVERAVLEDARATRERFEWVAAHATVVTLSARDSAWLYPGSDAHDVVDRLLGLGASIVALTLGDEGSIVASTVARVEEAVAGRPAVDVLGVDDSYTATLIHGLLHLEGSALDAARLSWIARRSAAAASITAARPGADPPWLAELEGALSLLSP